MPGIFFLLISLFKTSVHSLALLPPSSTSQLSDVFRSAISLSHNPVPYYEETKSELFQAILDLENFLCSHLTLKIHAANSILFLLYLGGKGTPMDAIVFQV